MGIKKYLEKHVNSENQFTTTILPCPGGIALWTELNLEKVFWVRQIFLLYICQ
jgi:hypothetical protein